MNNKAFTLIELLAVVTILGILSIIIIPIIDKNIKTSKERTYKIVIENIKLSAQNYFSDNPKLKPLNDTFETVTLEELIKQGYIDKIKNPKTGKEFEEEINIQLQNNSGKYTYVVCPIEQNCR